MESAVDTTVVNTAPKETPVVPKKSVAKKATPKKAVSPKKDAIPKGKSVPLSQPAPQPTPTASGTTEPKKAKAIKVNPSASYIGFKIAGPDAKTVNYRNGKKNIIECSSVHCTGANATGRRLVVTFHDAKGNQILERRVFKEYFEKMARVFGVLLPE